MTIDEHGYCSSCQHWILEHPSLECPWCQAARIERVIGNLGLDPAASPAAVLDACEAAFRAQHKEKRELITLRARAARALLADANPQAAAKAAHRTMAGLERWAVMDSVPVTCPKGHDRVTHGYRYKGKPGCDICNGPRPLPAPRKLAAQRKKPENMAAARQKYEARLAARMVILERRQDDLQPRTLRPPLPG